ncbi:MAG: hypothetical protein JXJ17_06405 [Anaerolineae bacterium]|nr:hypothetical protein [Anaerolineae bacterium]
MITQRWIESTAPAIAALLALLVMAGCGTAPDVESTSLLPTSTPTTGPTITIAPAITPTPAPALVETSMDDLVIDDFDAVHSPVDGGENEHLIFGNIQVPDHPADLPSDLAAFLGRWEGYSYGPPVRKDWKYVLVVQEIDEQEGRAVLWGGTNLQYPTLLNAIHFRVVPGEVPSIEWEYTDESGQQIASIAIAPDTGQAIGWLTPVEGGEPWGPIELNRDQSFVVYEDYPQYLADLRIYPGEYHDETLTESYGKGFLVYLPEGYEENPDQTWPLIIFLHGAGDRGDNLYLLAKASPFMMIRAGNPLPFIIIAPLMSDTEFYSSFPDNYLNGVLDQALVDYRVDESRIYVTGLSMGGEATYRFALLQPDRFAAIAPLAAYLFHPSPMEPIRDLPVWAIHGADDTIISPSTGQVPVDMLRAVGGNVEFTVLEGHDHDVWTDTYSDPAFYDWLLSHQRPQ